MLLGIDTGGTFTDFVLYDGQGLRVHKVLSTPTAPEQAILQGLRELGVSRQGLHIVHGSTVATNAVLEGKLARTVFITNHGLKDMLTIGRQARRQLYNLQPAPDSPPVAASMCIETAGRVDANGEVLEPLTAADLQVLREQLERLRPEAVAINLLFSFLNAAPERAIEAVMPAGVFVTRSSALLPVMKEYERGMATWLNAAVGPRMQAYLRRLRQELQPATLSVMQSSGDTVDAAQAAEQAVHLLLSGPAGGLLGAQAVAGASGHRRLMTFDMGGTSTDVALIDERIALSDAGSIAGWPVAVPMVDMHTIGAGGGSIAWLDDAGLLQVGPQSAGADPGPACYGLGGQRPTVTDANTVLGRLPSQTALGGSLRIQRERAVAAVSDIAAPLGLSVQAAAQGIIELANEHMARALRVISVEQGHDPADYTLVSFGGAGGLHVCALAEALGMGSAIAPVHAGVLSAYGMLAAPRGRQIQQTWRCRLAELDAVKVERLLHDLETQGRAALHAEGIADEQIRAECRVELRYVGQSSTLSVGWGPIVQMTAAFHQRHEERYGHRLDEPVEMVNVRVSVQAASRWPRPDPVRSGHGRPVSEQPVVGETEPVPVYRRQDLGREQPLQGPALVVEPSATTWIAAGWQGVMDEIGNLLLAKNSAGESGIGD